jgi:hypothetical protein
MNRVVLGIAVLASIVICSSAAAEWGVYGEGSWPKSWPQGLEALRKQAGTIQGGKFEMVIHHIPFKTRDEFELAWPELLKIKTKGAPLILVQSPSKHWHFGETKASVFVHCPSLGKEPAADAGPVAGVEDFTYRWMNTNYVVLVVDGEIVDLNRIKLPADALIIDKRFEKEKENAK